MPVKLVKHFLPGIADEELLGIFRLRVRRQSDLQNFLPLPEVAELVDKSDHDVIKNDVEQQKKQVSVQKELRAHIGALAVKVTAAGRKKREKNGRRDSATSPFSGRGYPAKVPIPDGAWAEAQVQEMCLPGAHILRDESNQRWLISFDGIRQSRIWSCWGYADSALMVVQLAWHNWADLGQHPPCPVEGLLERKFGD